MSEGEPEGVVMEVRTWKREQREKALTADRIVQQGVDVSCLWEFTRANIWRPRLKESAGAILNLQSRDPCRLEYVESQIHLTSEITHTWNSELY